MNLHNRLRFSAVVVFTLFLAACAKEPEPQVSIKPLDRAEVRPEIYAEFTLTADLSHLSADQRQMLGLLIEAADIMDDLFWRQSFGDDYRQWLESIDDARVRRFAELNYGPWDALDDDKPFIDGYGPKPLGAQFYPVDMSREEFESAVSHFAGGRTRGIFGNPGSSRGKPHVRGEFMVLGVDFRGLTHPVQSSR